MGSKSQPAPGPSWTRHVDSQYSDFDELFAAAEAVESLVAHPGWAHVTRLLAAEADQLMAVADGRLLESRSEYAHMHGRVGGLKGVLAAADAIRARAALRLEQQQSRHEGAAESVPGGRA